MANSIEFYLWPNTEPQGVFPLDFHNGTDIAGICYDKSRDTFWVLIQTSQVLAEYRIDYENKIAVLVQTVGSIGVLNNLIWDVACTPANTLLISGRNISGSTIRPRIVEFDPIGKRFLRIRNFITFPNAIGLSCDLKNDRFWYFLWTTSTPALFEYKQSNRKDFNSDIRSVSDSINVASISYLRNQMEHLLAADTSGNVRLIDVNAPAQIKTFAFNTGGNIRGIDDIGDGRIVVSRD